MIEGRPEWQRFAACHNKPWPWFFPGRGEPVEPAKSICGECPVRDRCLEYALANAEKFGIWGGTTERERRLIRRQRRKGMIMESEEHENDVLADAERIIMGELAQEVVRRPPHVYDAAVDGDYGPDLHLATPAQQAETDQWAAERLGNAQRITYVEIPPPDGVE